ncbi:uncharacterized protein A1O9_04079 [Exophiala aquamarina CBS 119918]|uniref:Uncharacterized protein n=1 Tax=Exophiala aquamarina CBS 119918 TaxID=1182545 RepID=A0A072PUN5_9EURO|nr:uncharacterized protein A1O9_04079 [Exophiala aquamarina CBS 119918]KEF59235.1 hypothetical protein A1O9_04079 [Exophiala aquamarina CBS 119918]
MRYIKDRSKFDKAVQSIPGLSTTEAEGEHCIKTFIGWDNDKIRSRGRRLEEEAAKEREQEAIEARIERERERQPILQRHHEYAKGHRVLASSLKLQDLAGSCVVRCDEIMKNWTPSEVMTLDIAAPKLHWTSALWRA